MKKEPLIAIILGIAAGIGVAVFVLTKARESQMLSSKSISTSLSITPTVSVRKNQFQPLELSSPESGTIFDTKTITLEGKAAKGSLLVVQSPLKTMVQKLDKDTFSIKDFPISLGENAIRITAYPSDIQIPPQEKELKVYYLDEQ